MTAEIDVAASPGEIREAIRDRAWRMLIGGELVAANRAYDAMDPSTATICARVADSDDSDIEAAVSSAQAASSGWAATDPEERARLLTTAADIVDRHSAELAALDSVDGGNPRSRAAYNRYHRRRAATRPDR